MRPEARGPDGFLDIERGAIRESGRGDATGPVRIDQALQVFLRWGVRGHARPHAGSDTPHLRAIVRRRRHGHAEEEVAVAGGEEHLGPTDRRRRAEYHVGDNRLSDVFVVDRFSVWICVADSGALANLCPWRSAAFTEI